MESHSKPSGVSAGRSSNRVWILCGVAGTGLLGFAALIGYIVSESDWSEPPASVSSNSSAVPHKADTGIITQRNSYNKDLRALAANYKQFNAIYSRLLAEGNASYWLPLSNELKQIADNPAIDLFGSPVNDNHSDPAFMAQKQLWVENVSELIDKMYALPVRYVALNRTPSNSVTLPSTNALLETRDTLSRLTRLISPARNGTSRFDGSWIVRVRKAFVNRSSDNATAAPQTSPQNPPPTSVTGPSTGPDLSTPEKALSLYFGSRTWGERLMYTLYADDIKKNSSNSYDSYFRLAYGGDRTDIVWPSGISHEVKTLTNSFRREGEEVVLEVTFNLKKAEKFSKPVTLEDVSRDLADKSWTTNYYLKYLTKGVDGPLGYRVDWKKTRTAQQLQLKAQVNKFAELKTDFEEMKNERIKTAYGLDNASVELRIANIQFSSAVTKVTWLVKNQSKVPIDGITIAVYAGSFGDTIYLGELRIDKLAKGGSITDVITYPTKPEGRKIRDDGFDGKIKAVRVLINGKPFNATEFFDIY
jgi:hypothetical protein